MTQFTTRFLLQATDTLFFRDGRPFNEGEGGNLEVTGVFPPSPNTVVGMLRAAMATSNGWTPKKKGWDEKFKLVLGDGPNLGPLEFRGPFVRYGEQLVFPVPRALMGVVSKTDQSCVKALRLRPGPMVQSDMGNVQLPTLDHDNQDARPKELDDYWITQTGLQKFLNGGIPSCQEFVQWNKLYSNEARVGIKRSNRITLENALYQTIHVRPSPEVKLEMHLNTFPQGWHQPNAYVPIGGEGRFVSVETGGQTTTLPTPPDLTSQATVRYTVTLLTPLEMHQEHLNWQTPNARLYPMLPGMVVSACVGKPIWIGGWDSLGNQPLPLQPHLPAGSTWFLKADKSEIETIKAQHLTSISGRKAWGYGLIAIGVWNEGGQA